MFKHMEKEQKQELALLLAGAVLLVTGLLLPAGWVRTALLLVTYAVIGFEVFKGMIEEFREGEIFTEEALMTLATIGALILKEHEAARWLSREELDTVDWLPADITIMDEVRELL